MSGAPQSTPFQAIKARHILLLLPVAWLLSMLLLFWLMVMLQIQVGAKQDLAQATLLAMSVGNLALVWYFSRKLKKLGLPIRYLLTSGTLLPRREFGRIFILNLTLVLAGFIPGHVYMLMSGKWTSSSDILLMRGPEDPDALTLNLLSFVSVVVMAPFAEEILFRGLMLHRLAAKWGRPRDAIWVSALIFGLLHGLAPGIFLLGVVLTLVYLKTGGSLRTTMALHACHNLAAMLLLNGMQGLGLGLAPETSGLWLAIEVLCLAIAALMAKACWADYRQSWQTWPPFLRVTEPSASVPAPSPDPGPNADPNSGAEPLSSQDLVA